VTAAVPATSRPIVVPTSAPAQTLASSVDQRSGSSNWQTVNGYDRPKTDMRYMVLFMVFFSPAGCCVTKLLLKTISYGSPME